MVFPLLPSFPLKDYSLWAALDAGRWSLDVPGVSLSVSREVTVSDVLWFALPLPPLAPIPLVFLYGGWQRSSVATRGGTVCNDHYKIGKYVKVHLGS